MIYLLKSAAFDDNDNPITILKIGYTDDIDKRLGTYRSHNPTIKLLHTIEGDEKIEELLHDRLRSYRFIFNEWYRYDDYIVQGFSTSKTSEELLNYFGVDIESYEKLTTRELKKNTIEEISKILVPLNNIISDGFNTYKAAKIYDSIEADIKKGFNLYEALENKYQASKEQIQEEVVRYVMSLESLADNVKEIVEKVDLRTPGRFSSKMKLVCENDLTAEEQTLLINSISIEFKNFYIVLGPEKCRSLGYVKGYLQKEYDSLVTDTTDKISSVIYSRFNIGSSYTFSNIKDELRKIYIEQDYNRTPKASDILNYFEVAELKLTNKETGKRDHYYKLLMKKK